MNSLVTPKNSPSKIQVGSVWPSNSCGDFEVVEYSTWDSISVRFIKTGYAVNTTSSNIKNGLVKDKLFPVVCGVGFVGNGRHEAVVGRKSTKPYQIWKDMLMRCYCPKARAKYPTYSDCVVSNEWHNYQAFADWFEVNYIDGFDLDKDKLSEGGKIYSPETCCFISHAENVVLAHAKDYAFISPDGAFHEGSNIKGFARLHGLDPSALTKVKNGKLKKHKGWKVGNLNGKAVMYNPKHIQEVAKGWAK
jgi:hypothetical protein